jgi:hypothetical protein
MAKPIKASEVGLESHYKVRIVMHGAILHAASWSKPKVILDSDEHVRIVRADWVDNDPAYGDTIGYIDWPEVRAVTWRYSE